VYLRNKTGIGGKCLSFIIWVLRVMIDIECKKKVSSAFSLKGGLTFHSQVGWEGNCYLLKLFLSAFPAANACEGGRHHRVLELVRQVESAPSRAPVLGV
jgi:hypothetical protein